MRARTGVCSSRFDVSAALRMSASPMLRTLAAWVANSGDRVWAVISACMKPSTLRVQRRDAGRIDLRGHRRRLGRGDGRGGGGAVRVSASPSGGANGAGAADCVGSLMISSRACRDSRQI